jgi:hypothetical protein
MKGSGIIKKIFKYIENILVASLKTLEYKIKELEYADAKKKWDLETGEKFNYIINHYAVSEETLLKICNEFVEFHELTNVDCIKDYLWINYERESPRLPWMIRNNFYKENI